MATADSQIADTLLEAEAEKTLAKSKPIPRGGLVSTAAMIRYNGGAAWGCQTPGKCNGFSWTHLRNLLPVAVFGQGAIHDRWRLDHHNSMDVSLHPDGPEGQALLGSCALTAFLFWRFVRRSRERPPGRIFTSGGRRIDTETTLTGFR